MSKRTAKTATELETIREAASISVQILAELRDLVKAGVYVEKIDEMAGVICERFGVQPAFKGVPGYVPFPGNLCLSINDTVLHAIPQTGRMIKSGDLVKLDFGIIHKGFYTDHCVTVGVEKLTIENEKLIKIGKMAVESAVAKALPGAYTGDLGYIMQTISQMAGFDVLKEYVGHAIGKSLHESPQIPAYGSPRTGDRLEPGMVLCIEAQVVAGEDEVYTEADGWTIRTADGANSVMFEYMVEITEGGNKVLTDTRDWPILVG